MGERIHAARCFIHALRHAKQPRYSFEHAAANLLIGVACLILTAIGEQRLWAGLFAAWMLSIGVQGFRAWKFVYQRNREHEEYLRQRMREAADA